MSVVVWEAQQALYVPIAHLHAVEVQQMILVQVVLTIALLRAVTIVQVEQTIMEEVRHQMKYLQHQGRLMDTNMSI